MTSNVSATVFREWSIDKIKSIISYLNEKANYEDFNIFQARNLLDLALWANYKTQQKKMIEQILYAVYIAHLNQQDSADISLPIDILQTTLKSYFYEKLSASCEICDEPFIPRCDCGGTLSVTKVGNFICIECGQDINNVHCDEGHEVVINGIDSVVLFPNASLMGNIRQTLKNAFDMKMTGLFKINNGRLTLISEQNGYLILPENLPEFKTTFDINIANDEHDDLLKTVKVIKEKCKNSITNKDCNNCDHTNKNICVMKMFTTFSEYRPSPHQANEFGDVAFTVTFDDKQCQLVGIAKRPKGETLTLSEAPAREMLQQILTATHDARIGIIAAICATRFHDQLTEELRYIAKLTGKPIVILDERYMMRQYKAYQEHIKTIS